ncbi:ABC transporter ATP-binding protein [Microbacterium sp. MPKO10]|uniref:ATP-binding cassette domain-containing protein n=1 Tax=Microbacterium sp. MPKO10 TaxID=2989818 RepID=UPI0022355DE3|nr:ABC transporter ATP-binding protein [Microbacterium sp. MPKO10]MCW4458486.1 ABC transporter ATP-binding protein/permease [Microbacterium sp. MPKO10]
MQISRLRRLARDTPPRGWGIVAASAVRAVLSASAFLAIGAVVDTILSGGDAQPFLLVAGACAIGAAVCAGVESLLPSHQQPVEEQFWRGRLATRMLTTPIDGREEPGDTVSGLTDAVERIAAYRSTFVGRFLGALIVPVAVLAVIAVSHGVFVSAVLAVCIALAPPLLGAAMARVRRPTRAHSAASASLAAEFTETVRALGTIAMLGAGPQRRERFARRAETARVEVMRMLRRNQLVLLATDGFFGLLVTAASGVAAMIGLAAGAFTAGQALALVLLGRLLLEPVDHVGREFYVGMAGQARQDAAHRALSTASSRDLPSPTVSTQASALPTCVRLEQVSIVRGCRATVREVTLDLPSRTITALIGPSGSGKTSLALALAGLLPTASGTITINGTACDASARTAAVAFVPQRTTLFTGTVADNLRLGAPGASDDRLVWALDCVGLTCELSNGGSALNRPLTTDGATISGGQAQRLSIARALVCGSPILVLDEPTSNLDQESAERVLRAVSEVVQISTVLLITHRHDELAWADRIAVMTDGVLSTTTREALA